ncbi:hypothetical protein [Paenibacillus paridis]|uniref:hypothetical protein n=1 Tax=Paenibacillus paridis TaxID=2583376 RepID=UPI001390A8A0|nr:hypothetical protein [Paenibacillus paridis]
MKRKLGIITLSCLIVCSMMLVLVSPESAFACSCAMSGSPESHVKDELERKTAVFSGEVLKVTPPGPKVFMSSDELTKVLFQVETVWKGKPEQQTYVYTAMSSASCGYENFHEGQSYIVSAYEQDGKLETGICELTKPLSMVQEELKVLGEGYPPEPLSKGKPTAESQTEAKQGSKQSYVIGGISILLVTVAAGVVLLIRHRRNST